MGTTSGGLRYPEPEDRLNQGHIAIQNLATDVQDKALTLGAQILGYAGSSTNVGPLTTVVAPGTVTGWPSIISVTVTVPTGARRVLVLGYAQLAASIVGNVELAVFDADTILLAGASPDPRVPNPTTVSYSCNVWGSHVPTPGSHTYHLRAKNNAAGNFTSYAHGLLVALL